MEKKGLLYFKEHCKSSVVAPVFSACTKYQGGKMPQKVLAIIKFNLMKSCMINWLTLRFVLLIMDWVINKNLFCKALSQQIISEFYLWQGIPSGMDLHTIISYWIEISFAQVVQVLSTKPTTFFFLIVQMARWVEPDFFLFLFYLLGTPHYCQVFNISLTLWVSQGFQQGICV